MVAQDNTKKGGDPRQFLVECENCSFERTVTGREAAERIADGHRTRTDHGLVAIELPPTARVD